MRSPIRRDRLSGQRSGVAREDGDRGKIEKGHMGKLKEKMGKTRLMPVLK